VSVFALILIKLVKKLEIIQKPRNNLDCHENLITSSTKFNKNRFVIFESSSWWTGLHNQSINQSKITTNKNDQWFVW